MDSTGIIKITNEQSYAVAHIHKDRVGSIGIINITNEQSYAIAHIHKDRVGSIGIINITNEQSYAIAHIHKDRVDRIGIINITNEFVSKTVNRKHSFGIFNENDKDRQKEFRTVGSQTNI